jgi:hypothetical protein
MPADDKILVTCTDGTCPVGRRVPLLDLQTFILIHTDRDIPSHDAVTGPVPCPACQVDGRDGILIYLPPKEESAVPALTDAASALWLRVKEASSRIGDVETWEPSDQRHPVGVALDVRPYGGFVLGHGDDDAIPQYGGATIEFAKAKPTYIRELKRDLLYLTYFSDRERKLTTSAGVSRFDAMAVGAILALKFDLMFFYGVPTTGSLEAATFSDDEARGLSFESFDKPIFFNPAAIGENPIKPIYGSVLAPFRSLGRLGEAHAAIAEALVLHAQLQDGEASARERRAKRTRLLKQLRFAQKQLGKDGPGPLSLPSNLDSAFQRRRRPLDEVVSHSHFAEAKHKPWSTFESLLRAISAFADLPTESFISSIEQVIAEEEGKGDVARLFQDVLSRHRKYVESAAALDATALQDVAEIVGGLPETFEPYLAAMRKQAVVDHATAIYIKAAMAGIKIGTDKGKIRHRGRKLMYRAPDGGLTGELDTRKEYADLVIEKCKERGRFVVPVMIMLERHKNESGLRATSKIGPYALTKAERGVHIPMVGIDWSNWGRRDDGAVTRFFFSELFTNSVAHTQELPGYHGPIVHSRGVGGGQVTLPTLMDGVSPKKRAKKSDDVEWACGIPVSKDNASFPAPPHWTGAEGSIDRSLQLFKNKFAEGTAKRDCTFGRVSGGKDYDCSACLARFDLSRDFAPFPSSKKIASYRCTVDASRWEELFGEPLLDDSPQQRREFPCTWLHATQKYAGGGIAGYKRIGKTGREIVALGSSTIDDEGTDATAELRRALKRVRDAL